MCHIHRADQVNLQHRLPVDRIELPEREAELPRADADGEYNVVALTEAVLHFLAAWQTAA